MVRDERGLLGLSTDSPGELAFLALCTRSVGVGGEGEEEDVAAGLGGEEEEADGSLLTARGRLPRP